MVKEWTWEDEVKKFNENPHIIAIFGKYAVWVDYSSVDGRELYLEGTHEVDTYMHDTLQGAVDSALWGWMNYPNGRPV